MKRIALVIFVLMLNGCKGDITNTYEFQLGAVCGMNVTLEAVIEERRDGKPMPTAQELLRRSRELAKKTMGERNP